MTAAIFQKARKNRVLALRTVAARNARAPQGAPGSAPGASAPHGPTLELVTAPVQSSAGYHQVVA